MSFVSEFKEFATRGNVVDLAVGVVIGAAFGKIVTALVEKVVMPPVGLLVGGVDFSSWAITLREASTNAAGKAIPAVTLGIGDFINTIIQFIIIAFAIFLAIKAINAMRRNQVINAPAEPSAEVKLLTEIRDELRKK